MTRQEMQERWLSERDGRAELIDWLAENHDTPFLRAMWDSWDGWACLTDNQEYIVRKIRHGRERRKCR